MMKLLKRLFRCRKKRWQWVTRDFLGLYHVTNARYSKQEIKSQFSDSSEKAIQRIDETMKKEF